MNTKSMAVILPAIVVLSHVCLATNDLDLNHESNDFKPYNLNLPDKSESHPIYNPPILSAHQDDDPDEELNSIIDSMDTRTSKATHAADFDPRTESESPELKPNLDSAESSPSPETMRTTTNSIVETKESSAPTNADSSETIPEPASESPSKPDTTPLGLDVEETNSEDQIYKETQFEGSAHVESDSVETQSADIHSREYQSEKSLPTIATVESQPAATQIEATETTELETEGLPTKETQSMNSEPEVAEPPPKTFQSERDQVGESKQEDLGDSRFQSENLPTKSLPSEEALMDDNRFDGTEPEGAQFVSLNMFDDFSQLILYTIFCLVSVSSVVFAKHILGGDKLIVKDDDVKPVKTKQSNMDSHTFKKLQTQLESLRERKSHLIKRLKEQQRRMPIIEEVKKLKAEFGTNIKDKISEKRTLLQTMKILKKIREENETLSEKVRLAIYEQLVMITVWVKTDNLPSLLEDLKFRAKSSALEETSMNMQVEAEFLVDHVKTLEELRDSYIEEIKLCDKELVEVRERNLIMKDRLSELRDKYDLHEMMKQIDDLKARTAENDAEAARCYKEYYDNYKFIVENGGYQEGNNHEDFKGGCEGIV